MTSVKTFLKFCMPYAEMHPGFRETIKLAMVYKDIDKWDANDWSIYLPLASKLFPGDTGTEFLNEVYSSSMGKTYGAKFLDEAYDPPVFDIFNSQYTDNFFDEKFYDLPCPIKSEVDYTDDMRSIELFFKEKMYDVPAPRYPGPSSHILPDKYADYLLQMW
jgi:hypothetical protein